MSKLFVCLLLISSAYAAKKHQINHGNEIIVKLNQNIKIINGHKVRRRFLIESGLYGVIKVESKSNFNSTLESIKSQKSISFAEPNYRYTTNQLPSDPLYKKLWGLSNNGKNEPKGSSGNSSARGVSGADIGAVKAWAITKGSKNIKIAVIDTGIDYLHPDLKQNIWVNKIEMNGAPGVDDDKNGYVDDVYGYDFANNDSNPMDDNGHGTHCAGTIGAAHNNVGVSGVMANVSLVAIKFIKSNGSGSVESAIRAIDYAVKVGVDVMSNSWGGEGRSELLVDSIRRAEAKGILFVAAAGNASSNNDLAPQYPASYKVSNIISVASHTYNDDLSSFSCYGKKSVHLAAPGTNILSTFPNNQYKVLSGTSMAAPHVSGVLGLYLSKNSNESYKSVIDRLNKSTVFEPSYRQTTISKGRVNAYNILKGIYPEKPSVPANLKWTTLDYKLESNHPYDIDTTKTYTISVPGAKYIKVHFDKIDIEKKYDQLRLLDKNGNLESSIFGSETNYIADPIKGDKVIIELMSDISVARWGFKVSQIEYAK